MIPAQVFSAETAAETPKVEIVSFMRDTDTGLRSSELLQAKVTGYDGHIHDLTYKWTNDLGSVSQGWWSKTYYGTYLYVYSSHNMYSVQGTPAEQEIYNSSRQVNPSDNMAGNTHDRVFEGQGYAWAAVYGANLDTKDYTTGSITVEVYDGDTLIGSDTYSGFKAPNLQSDLDSAVFGLFEGETIDVRDLLGESAIVHISCSACSVTSAKITSTNGSKYIQIGGRSPAYTVTGLAKGEAQIQIRVSKDNCKFHQNQSNKTASPKVHVFKKPVVTPGLTTLTLTNIDPHCVYYINHVEGKRQPDGTVLFDGLDYSTTYEIEVKATYTDNGVEENVFAFVNGTTLTPNVAAVRVRLDETYTTLDKIGETAIVLRKLNANGQIIDDEIIPLTYQASSNNYTALVGNGIYGVYDAEGNRLGRQLELVVNNTDASAVLNYYTVSYDPNGGTLSADDRYIYYIGETVNAIQTVPVREGYTFLGWKYADQVYQPGNLVTNGITAPMSLVAQWEDAVDVYVNISINHYCKDNEHHDHDASHRAIVPFTLDARPEGSTGDYDELATFQAPNALFDKEETPGSKCEHPDFTYYTANAPVLKNMPRGLEYTFTTDKLGYSVTGVTQTVDHETGDITVHAELIYNPQEVDFQFSVVLDEASKALTTNYKPIAAAIKVSYWSEGNWHTVDAHKDTYVKVDLDENGYGTGHYPVADKDSAGNPYIYRIEVVALRLPDGTIVPLDDTPKTDLTPAPETNVVYVSDHGRYSAKVNVTGGTDPETGNTDALTGAYVDGAVQHGAVQAVISIKTHSLTIDPNGGRFTDGSTDFKVIDQLIRVPERAGSAPTRDGGYVFAGWYVVDENGQMTDEQLVEGAELYEDVTVRAKWLEPLTIHGDVTAEYFYYNIPGDTSTLTYIPLDARISYTDVILLRALEGTTNFNVVAEQDVFFDVNAERESVANFRFEGLQAATDGGVKYTYIVAVRQANYAKQYDPYYTYQHFDVSGNLINREAAKPEIVDNVGEGHIRLNFLPEEFLLNFKVDTSKIADPNCRPTEVKVVYLEVSANDILQQWEPISQHLVTGLSSTFDGNGIASGMDHVWKTTPDSTYNYLYQLKVVSYKLNGQWIDLDAEEVPLFNIYYGEPVSVASGETPTVTAVLSPLPHTLSLDTKLKGAELSAPDYSCVGTSSQTGASLYNTTFFYGTGIDALPTPVMAGHAFLGWYDAVEGGNQVTNIPSTTRQDVYLYARWEEAFTVNFFSNLTNAPDVVFRTYYPAGITLPEGDQYQHLTAEGKIPSYFYDIPQLSYADHNGYIFKGWYLDQDNDNDSRPISWDAVYEDDTNIYAHWIYVGTVEQEDDGKTGIPGGTYAGYDLVGVQIRDAEMSGAEHYHGDGNRYGANCGENHAGLRFITVLSEHVWSGIHNIHAKNAEAAEYGFVMAKKSTAVSCAGNDTSFTLEYCSSNVNGMNTLNTHEFVRNQKCNGVADHFSGAKYRLYTTVLTYHDYPEGELADAYAMELLARSYIRYYDANGLYRTYYNNYTGTPVYNGCSASYNMALGAMGGAVNG